MKYATDGIYLIEFDKHIPDHDPRVSNLILEVLTSIKPDGYINIGDAGDFPQISTHEKDPRKMRRVETDVDDLNAYWDDIEGALRRGADVHLLEGNHEARWMRYHMRNAKEAIGLARTWPELYLIAERNSRGRCKWYHHNYDQFKSLKLGDTVVHHGFYYDKHTAVSNLTRYRGYNLVQGHSHRRLYASNGDFWSLSGGHGVIPARSNHSPTPGDHDQGIAILSVIQGRGEIESYQIKNGRAIVRGRLFKG